MLVGILAGLVSFGFASIFGEPPLDRAIAFEGHDHHAGDHAHEMAGDDAAGAAPVSRAVQSTVGLFTGIVIYGCALGGIFAMVFAYAHGRIGPLSPRATAALLAAAGFVAIILVPQIKYPASPPAVGTPETIGARTALYFAMIVLSVLAGIAAAMLRGRLVARLGGWNASILAGAGYLAVVVIAMLALPAVDEVPADFSAAVLWQFRTASLGTQVVLWATLGLVFGALAERRLGRRHGDVAAEPHAAVRQGRA
jgi:predicted cobalt transporter CbtA